jgi:outer membrane protein TolC
MTCRLNIVPTLNIVLSRECVGIALTLASLLGIPECWAGPDNIESTFQYLKQKAADNSYDIKIADKTAVQKGAQLYTSWTRWVPRVDLQLSQSRSKNFAFLTSGALGGLSGAIEPQALSLARWDLNLTFPLYRRSVLLGIQQSSIEKLLSQEQRQLKLTELDWRLRSLLGNYLLASFRVETIGKSIEIAKSNMTEAKLRYELGQRTRIDVLRTEANLASLESERILQQERQTTELNRLLEYGGFLQNDIQDSGLSNLIETEEALSTVIDQFTEVKPTLPTLEAFLGADAETTARLEKQIVDLSSTYKTFIIQEELTSSRARNLIAQEWPELVLQGSINKQTPEWNDALKSGDRSYSLTLALNIPIFSAGSSISSNVEKWNAQDIGHLKREQDILHFKDEIESERTQIRSLLKALEARKLNYAQNEEIVRLSFKSYQLGKTTVVELLGSQNDLINSKINLAKTKIDLSNSVRQFAWNIGIQLH